MYVTAFVVGLILVIMFHEFGHYATAKAFGMKVDRFFLGFGPTVWSFRRGETEYGVKAIPAGGFVRIAGMTPFEQVDEADRGRLFYEQAAWKRAIVLVAGSFTHFVVAVGLLVAALAVVGVPTATNGVAQVVDDSPADDAGLRPGDRVVAVDGTPTADFGEVREIVVASPGERLVLTLERDGQRLDLPVHIASQSQQGRPAGFLGVGPVVAGVTRPLGTAIADSLSGEVSVWRLSVQTVQGLGQVFSPQALSRWFGQVDEPGPRTADGPMSLVGVGQTVNALGAAGEVFWVLVLIANLNVVLGVMNMLPLPPLDGGHLAVLVVERVVNGVRRLRGRADTWRIDPSVLTPVALAVILVFVALSVTAVYVDIVKPATGLLQ